jgi:hypothetical protein
LDQLSPPPHPGRTFGPPTLSPSREREGERKGGRSPTGEGEGLYGFVAVLDERVESSKRA